MAKTSSVEKNNRRRRSSTAQSADKRKRLKAIANDLEAPAEERFAARIKLAEMPRNSSPTRIRNRCEITGRARGYYRKLKMCRNQLRELASRASSPAWSSRAGKGSTEHGSERSLGRYADAHPQRADAAAAEGRARPLRTCARAFSTCSPKRATSAATRASSRRAAIPSSRSSSSITTVSRRSERSRASRRRAGACIRRCGICRPSPTASASRSFPRPRA